jgi:hypothetical protein
MNDENDLEANGRLVIEVLSRICPEGQRKTTKALNQDSCFPTRGLNQERRDYQLRFWPSRSNATFAWILRVCF